MKYKPLLLSPLGLIPAALQADAADMPMPVRVREAPVVAPYAPSWAGFYIGVNAGGIVDRSNQRAFLPDNTTTFDEYCWVGDCTFRNKQTATGFLAGGHIGYNFQTSNWVFGMEADLDWANAKKTTTGAQNGYTWTARSGVDAFGSTRLRVGYAFDNALLYVTGGVAYAKLKNTHQENPGYSWSQTAGWRLGWTAGGGVEFLVARNWTIRGEGLYYDLGKEDHISIDPVVGPSRFGLRDASTGVVGRIGLSYLFR